MNLAATIIRLLRDVKMWEMTTSTTTSCILTHRPSGVKLLWAGKDGEVHLYSPRVQHVFSWWQRRKLRRAMKDHVARRMSNAHNLPAHLYPDQEVNAALQRLNREGGAVASTVPEAVMVPQVVSCEPVGDIRVTGGTQLHHHHVPNCPVCRDLGHADVSVSVIEDDYGQIYTGPDRTLATAEENAEAEAQREASAARIMLSMPGREAHSS